MSPAPREARCQQGRGATKELLKAGAGAPALEVPLAPRRPVGRAAPGAGLADWASAVS